MGVKMGRVNQSDFIERLNHTRRLDMMQPSPDPDGLGSI